MKQRKTRNESRSSKGQDVGETRKPVSHKHHQSLKATRSFDASFFSGASKKDTREDWPKPRVAKRNYKPRHADELGHLPADEVEGAGESLRVPGHSWFVMPTSLLTVDRRAEVLHRRAISDPVIDHVTDDVPRYVEFEEGDWETFLSLHSHPETRYRRLVNQSGGLVVNRWDIDGSRLPSYIRFDIPVISDHRRRGPDGSPRTTNYVYPSRLAMGNDCAKRIDVHPLARPLLTSSPTPPIYLCLEGCLKADALLSSGQAAVSVPSVTMWKVSEGHLASYLELFRRAPGVFVVPDSDYLAKPCAPKGQDQELEVINSQVRYQTDRSIRWLRDNDVRATYLVPPYLDADEAFQMGISVAERWKVGIDDHLAWRGNLRRWDTLGNTQGVYIWEPPAPDVTAWLPPHPTLRPRRDRDRRDRQLLQWLIPHHGPFGVFSPKDATNDLRWSRDKIQDSSRSLQERGVLKVWSGKPILSDDGTYINKPHVYKTITPSLDRVLEFQAA